VQKPADVRGELRGFGSREQHAIVQGVKKSSFADPAFFLDQFGVHDGDLTGRPAEADEAEFQPEAKGLGETGVSNWFWVRHRGINVHQARFAYQKVTCCRLKSERRTGKRVRN
jgi:hypothetical protein